MGVDTHHHIRLTPPMWDWHDEFYYLTINYAIITVLNFLIKVQGSNGSFPLSHVFVYVFYHL